MKILLLSNGYPSNVLPFGSIYVKNHYDRLNNIPGYAVDKHVILRRNTSLFGSVIKYLWCLFSFVAKMPRRYDVIHVHFLSPLYILAYLYKISKPECKIVVTFHGSDINELSNPFLIKMYKYLFKKNDISIAVGVELKKKAEKLLETHVDHTLPAGFNDDIFHNKGNNYDQREIDFLYVGSFLPVKGLDTLIKAITKLNNPSIKFVFVGTGQLKSELEDLSETYNVEVIQGVAQNKLNDIYNSAKFFILPSRKEGFGLALTEAMYCGAVGVVRDIPQLRFQVSENENGFLFKDVEDLVSVINKCNLISSEEWNKLSQTAKNGSGKYSLSNVIDAMKAIYENGNSFKGITNNA